MQKIKHNGFTLIEVLVTVAIIGILSTIVLSSIGRARIKARDAKRKVEVSSIGRLVTSSCYIPNAGPGEYDISDLVQELATTNGEYSKYISQVPKDPAVTDSVKSLYMYIVTADKKCAVYANLENQDEQVTLSNINTQTGGGGTGVFEAATNGWNGTKKYFQVSN